MVEWLCSNGADPYTVDNVGRTPIDESSNSSDRIRLAIERSKRKISIKTNPEFDL